MKKVNDLLGMKNVNPLVQSVINKFNNQYKPNDNRLFGGNSSTVYQYDEIQLLLRELQARDTVIEVAVKALEALADRYEDDFELPDEIIDKTLAEIARLSKGNVYNVYKEICKYYGEILLDSLCPDDANCPVCYKYKKILTKLEKK